jgi:hypothetical protein
MTGRSWLACDAFDAVRQVFRADAIASKPAPTVMPQIAEAPHDRWELACLRCIRRGLSGISR